MSANSTKEFIIETANRLFLEQGYENVTVKDICDACKITKTTFYYHLKSKEAIILDFYGSLAQVISRRLISILTADNHWEQLMMLFEMLIEETRKYGTDFMSQMFISNLKEDAGSFDMREELTEIAVAIVKKGQEAGQIRSTCDAAALYTAAAYTFSGMEVMWCIKNGEFDWKLELRRAMEVIFDADPTLRAER